MTTAVAALHLGWIEEATVFRHAFVNAIYPPGSYRRFVKFQEQAERRLLLQQCPVRDQRGGCDGERRRSGEASLCVGRHRVRKPVQRG